MLHLTFPLKKFYTFYQHFTVTVIFLKRKGGQAMIDETEINKLLFQKSTFYHEPTVFFPRKREDICVVTRHPIGKHPLSPCTEIFVVWEGTDGILRHQPLGSSDMSCPPCESKEYVGEIQTIHVLSLTVQGCSLFVGGQVVFRNTAPRRVLQRVVPRWVDQIQYEVNLFDFAGIALF